tara:strand:- start:122 stop:262 length:141 start_codon:yes stop_codon:yes gene_type:complete
MLLGEPIGYLEGVVVVVVVVVVVFGVDDFPSRSANSVVVRVGGGVR